MAIQVTLQWTAHSCLSFAWLSHTCLLSGRAEPISMEDTMKMPSTFVYYIERLINPFFFPKHNMKYEYQYMLTNLKC